MPRRLPKGQRLLVTVLNIVGFFNIFGVAFIISREKLLDVQHQQHQHQHQHYGATAQGLLQSSLVAPFERTNQKSKPSNKHKGVNVTVLKLRELGFEFLPLDYPRIPPWWMIEDQYGDKPIIKGLDVCQSFRRRNRAHWDQLIIGPAGLFNSGTNLLSTLLQQNCYYPDRNPQEYYHGMAFQVPYGKHTPPEYRGKHTINYHIYQNMVLDAVLPVVMVRHPYDWMKSTCERPYSVGWGYREGECPQIVTTANVTFPARVGYGVGNITYESIAHLWNRWNRAYFDSMAFPHLMVRMEDLIFYPQETVTKICTCAGGSMAPEFSSMKKSAKDGQSGHYAHDRNLVDAFTRYGNFRNWPRFPMRDHVAARAILDKEMMGFFQYKHPDPEQVHREKRFMDRGAG